MDEQLETGPFSGQRAIFAEVECVTGSYNPDTDKYYVVFLEGYTRDMWVSARYLKFQGEYASPIASVKPRFFKMCLGHNREPHQIATSTPYPLEYCWACSQARKKEGI